MILFHHKINKQILNCQVLKQKGDRVKTLLLMTKTPVAFGIKDLQQQFKDTENTLNMQVKRFNIYIKNRGAAWQPAPHTIKNYLTA